MRAPDVRARVRHGHRLRVLDLSAGGALVEAGGQLRPGSLIELQVEHHDRQTSLGATVVRCDVSAISAHRGTTYRAGLAFRETCEWLCEGWTRGEFGVHAQCGESVAFAGDQVPAREADDRKGCE
jgi:hypothetical protein